jgi:LysM repeat protein
MRWRVLFIVSACVNAVMLMAVWHYAHKASQPAAASLNATTNSASPRTQVVVRRQFFMWNEVESTDYATYMANLRDIGCPEQTIRDIIIADVNALFAKRRAELVRPVQQQWWRASLPPEIARKVRELETQRRELLAKLLGADWAGPVEKASTQNKSGLVLDGPVLGPLSDEVKQSINDIVAKSQERMQALQASAAAEGRKPTAAELAAIRNQTRTELQGILTPSQLEEFLLRYSQSAIDLRSDLAGLRYFEVTPNEFRALFRAQDAFDQKIAPLLDSTDPNDIRARRSLEQQRDRAFQLALGAKRFELYTQLHDPVYRNAYAQAAAAGDPNAAGTIYEINQATADELAWAQANPDLTAEQQAINAKRIELEQAKATAVAVGQDIPPDPNAPPPPQPPQNRTHIIKSGDTLGALSTAYGVPVNVILDANPGIQLNNLRIGQHITIPPEAGAK